MSAVVGGIIAGGAALAGGIGGAIISSNAAGHAADTQAGAAEYAADLQNQQYQQTREDQAPYRQAGYQALSQMGDPSFNQTFNPSDMESVDPGYNFRMQQGSQALERSAAARGGLMSGGTLKGIAQYGQDYASGEYQNAYNRFTNDQTNRFNRLASLAGLGQTANGMTATAGMNMANGAGEAMMGGANARGAAMIAGGNAYGGAISGGLSGLGTNYYQGQMLSHILPQGGYPGGYPGGSMQAEIGQSQAPYQYQSNQPFSLLASE